MVFNECVLKDLTIDGRGYYGIGASAVPYDINKFTYLRITDINDDGTLNYSGLMSVDDKDADKYLLQPNDIVFARTGASTGRNYLYDGEIANMVYAGFLIKYSLDSKKVNPKYIKYYCLSKTYRDWVKSVMTGSTRGNVNEKQFGNMPIMVPERHIQDKIVILLDSLTNKIKLNNEINNNLQELINKTFIEYFVNYTIDNVKLECIESDIGLIPKGWSIGVLSDIVEFSNGYGFDSKKMLDKYENDTYSVFKMGNINIGGGINKSKTKSWMKKKDCEGLDKFIAKKGDILMCMTDMKNSGNPLLGHTALIDKDNEFVINQRVGILRCTKGISYEYVYTLSNLEFFISDLRSRANSGVQVNLTTTGICDTQVLIPNIECIDKFNKIAKPLYEKKFNIMQQNETLEQLRDTLLPKLMNGEIDLDNIEI